MAYPYLYSGLLHLLGDCLAHISWQQSSLVVTSKAYNILTGPNVFMGNLGVTLWQETTNLRHRLQLQAKTKA